MGWFGVIETDPGGQTCLTHSRNSDTKSAGIVVTRNVFLVQNAPKLVSASGDFALD